MLRDPFLEMVTEEGRKDFLCMEPKGQETQKNVTIVVFHTFNSGTGLGLVTGRWISEFKFSLVFRWSYWTAKVIQTNLVSKKVSSTWSSSHKMWLQTECGHKWECLLDVSG